MFFQVDFPAQKVNPKKKVQMEPEEIPILSLAPFTSIPKVCFDDVIVGTNVTRTLIIHNPTPNDIMLHITKAPPDERCFFLSWNQCMILPQEKVELELFWRAEMEGAWKDTIIFEDGHRLKKIVGIIFKAIKPKKVKVKPKKVVKCVSTKVKSPKKWFSPKQKTAIMKSPKSNGTRAVLPDITNIPQIYVESPKSNLIESNFGISNQSTYVIKNKENLELSGIENLSFTVNVTPSRRTMKKNYSDIFETRNNVEVNFEDSLEIKKDSLELGSSFRLHELDKEHMVHQTPSCIEDKLKAMTFTPVQSIPPNLASTIEKTQYSTVDNVLDVSNVSSATYNIDKRSPGLNIEEKLSDISSSTYIKEVCSSTYTKDSISAELSPSPTASPILSERNTRKDNIAQRVDSNYNFEVLRPIQCLEQILEESYVSFNASSVSSTETRKRRSEFCASAISPKRISKGTPTVETSVQNELPKRSFSQRKSLNLRKFINKTRENLIVEEVVIGRNRTTETSMRIDVQPLLTRDPFILTATNSIDPFMSSTMYYDPKWVDEQERGFKKWLNALLTPPAELNSNAEGAKVNIAKLWQDCKTRDVSKAPTREAVSSQYHTRSRLESLRRSANNFFRSPEISDVLAKICNMIENQKLVIRADRNVHLDLGLQTEIIGLFLSYNTLWLRIGLETIYNISIPLQSNSDVVGLAMFLSENFFKDRYLLKKYRSVHSNKYALDIKKHILKKFLMFVFFVDQAKAAKLIPHDPCLFCRNAAYKESRDIILRFSRELLSSVGDVTKVVRHAGYVLTHKQMYIHEFDFAVNNLGADLRDGVRLAKVAEIILVVEGLTDKLRTPAISRLQKVHNMKVVFDALQSSGFSILYEIEPRDIVDGHKEKTLSFLWQLIYKFQAPRINKAVATIQTFWRSLRIVVKRRILRRERSRREEAALKIQRWYKRVLLSRKLERIIPTILEIFTLIRTEKATTIIQKNVRMTLVRRRYTKLRNTVIGLQSYARRYLVLENINAKAMSVIKIQAYFRMHLARKRFLKLKASVRVVEEVYAARKAMKTDLLYYQRLKSATLYVQSKFKAKLATRSDMLVYAQMKSSTILIQSKFRAWKLMRIERTYYLKLKMSAILIQGRYRANKCMVTQRDNYQRVKSSAIFIQRLVRAKQQMIRERNSYQNLKAAAVVIQQRYRAKKIGETARRVYLETKSAVRTVEERILANKLMREQRQAFVNMKMAVRVFEERYVARKLAKIETNKYKALRRATMMVQGRLRANIKMKTERESYLALKKATVSIQRRYRARCLAKAQRNHYLQIHKATVIIQRRYRAFRLKQIEQRSYWELKKATVIIQQRFRANKLARTTRTWYLNLKRSVRMMEERRIANIKMKTERENYLELKMATVCMQRRYRAKCLARTQRNRYLQIKKATLIIQSRYRDYRLKQIEHQSYLKLKEAVVVIQQRFRANKLSRAARTRYLNLKLSVRIVEEQRIANIKMKRERESYLALRKATVSIQRRYKAQCLAKTQRCHYLQINKATVIIQRRYRAFRLMQIEQRSYWELKKAAVMIQQRFRANKLAIATRTWYLNLKRSVRTLEERRIANIKMKTERENYLELKMATVCMQRRYRAKCLAKTQRNHYLQIKKAAVIIQRRYRAIRLMKIELQSYWKLKEAVAVIQQRFRANKLARAARTEYLNLKRSVRIVQERRIANIKMKTERESYLELKKAVVSMQKRYKANCLAKTQRNRYLQIKTAGVIIQRRYRAFRLMQVEQQSYWKLKRAVAMIQQRFRANKLTRTARTRYLCLKESVRIVEERRIANKLTRVESERYRRFKQAAVLIQRTFRANRQAKSTRNYYLELRHATIVIQRRYRAFRSMTLQRFDFLHLRTATVFVQQRFMAIRNGRRERSRYLKLKNAVRTIEDRYQAKVACRKHLDEFNLLTRTVISIQRRYRANRSMRCERESFLKLKRSTILIQRLWRAKLACRKRSYNIIIVQAFVRGFLARRWFKEEHLPILLEKRQRKEIEKGAATKIQACWRGYRTRSLEKVEMAEIRKKAKIACKKASVQETLAYKKEKALSIITDEDSTIDQIIAALQDLAYETRLLKQTCLDLSECLPQELYKMISTSTRSLPEMHACTAATDILINFCKHPMAIDNCWFPKDIDGLFTVMIHWCDKDCPLFLRLCTLIWHLAQDKRRNRIIKGVPGLAQKLAKMKQLVHRKHNMFLRVKNKTSDSIFCPYTKLPMPSLEPEWGLDYKHRPRTFKNALHALDCVLKVLGV